MIIYNLHWKLFQETRVPIAIGPTQVKVSTPGRLEFSAAAKRALIRRRRDDARSQRAPVRRCERSPCWRRRGTEEVEPVRSPSAASTLPLPRIAPRMHADAARMHPGMQPGWPRVTANGCLGAKGYFAIGSPSLSGLESAIRRRRRLGIFSASRGHLAEPRAGRGKTAVRSRRRRRRRCSGCGGTLLSEWTRPTPPTAVMTLKSSATATRRRQSVLLRRLARTTAASQLMST